MALVAWFGGLRNKLVAYSFLRIKSSLPIERERKATYCNYVIGSWDSKTLG